MLFRSGTVIEARGIVDDLNVAMTWLTYPGRGPRIAKAADLEF